MPDFSLYESSMTEQGGANAATTLGSQIAGIGLNTKGNWVPLITTTLFESSWIVVTLNDQSTGAKYLVDIGIGAAGTETVVVPNLHYSSSGSGAFAAMSYVIPVTIPAGVRVSTRSQASANSASCKVNIQLIASAFGGTSGGGLVKDYGTSAADSGLTAVDPGGTANTKSGWIPLVASTDYPTKWIIICFAHDNVAIASSEHSWMVDIGTGATGQETVILSNILLHSNSSTDSPQPAVLGFPMSIPAGTRVSARCQCNLTTATERVIDVGFWGVS